MHKPFEELLTSMRLKPMRLSNRFLTAFFCLCCFGFLLIQTVQSEIKSVLVSPDTLCLEFDFSKESDAETTVLPRTYESMLVTTESSDLAIQEISRDSESIQGNAVLADDIAIGLDEKESFYQTTDGQTGDAIEKHVIGSLEGRHWIQLKVFHYAQMQGRMPECIRKISLKVIGKNISLVQNGNEKYRLISSIGESKRLGKFALPEQIRDVDSENSKAPRLKMWVTREGMYVIPQVLLKKSGWDVSRIDPRLFRVRHADGEIPIRVMGEEDGSFDFTDAIEFWGEPLWDKSVPGEKRLDVYSTSNIYWLEIGDKPGIRMGQEEGWISGQDPNRITSSRFYPYTQHEEKDWAFQRLPYAVNVQDGDYWFYTGAINGGEKRPIGFNLSLPDRFATQLARIRVKMRGQATSLLSQSVEVFLNDKMVASGSWRASDAILLESSDISPTFLQEKENVLTLVNRSTEEELAPLYLDWFEITYPRLYEAKDDYIRFRAPQNSAGKICQFEIKGFSSRTVDVYKIGVSKITGSKIVTVTDTLGKTTQTLRFDDAIVDENTEYVALAPSKKLLPDSVQLVENMHLRSENRGADYVMITSSDSLGLANLQSLVQFREAQGLKVSVVRLDSIYNEFNAGIPNPAAIRRFLQFTKQYWNPAPRWVLLVGDGAVDNRLPPAKGNVIPTRMVQTAKYGATVSDYWYTLLDGDDYPDMAVGRLPVKNILELQAVVEKILNYEKSPPDAWKNRYLMIGADYVGATLFRNQSETLIRELCPPKTEPKRLYVWGKLNDPNVGAIKELLNHFHDGVGYVNFRGHGGGAIWADAGLLDLERVKDIDNKDKLSIVSSMTCFTGDFTINCLGKALLNQAQNGAVAFFGSSGTGWTYADYYLIREFYALAFAEPKQTLGELIQAAKTNYLLTNSGELGTSEVHQYNLLGDPAIRLSFPENEMPLMMENRSVSFSDSIQIRGVSSMQPFQMRLDWTGQDRATVASWTKSMQQQDWKTSLSVPAGFQENRAGVRAYVWDEKSGFHANGYVSFAIGKSYFDSLQTIPERPTSRDSILFTVRVQDPAGIKRIWCNVFFPRQDSIPAMPMSGTDAFITSQWFSRCAPGSRLSYAFSTENSTGVISRSDTVDTSIPSLPDLAILTIKLSGSNQVLLESEIRNFGMEPVAHALVRFVCPEIGFFKLDTVSVKGDGTALARVPFPSFSGMATFMVTVNPDSAIVESSYQNNLLGDRIPINRFNVTPDSGSLSLEHPGKVGLPGKLDCIIPPGAVSKASVFQMDALRDENGISGTEMYRLSFADAPAVQTVSKEITLVFHPLSGDSSRAFKPYWFADRIQRWIRCDCSDGDSGMVVKTKNLGVYRLWASMDRQAPVLELQVDGQPFASGGYVSKNPLFSLIVQDSSGVDIRPEKLHIVLDEIEQETSQFIIPDSSANPVNATVSFRPTLQPGNHTILAKASDVHGNAGQTEKVAFMVSEAFSIQYLGNHPNPFKRETVFVYLLTDAAERVSLKIYTVSGRRIRVFEDAEMAGADYHEVIWDGKDEWGEDVANGVYFFRLAAETNGIHKETTGKIARLR